MKLSDKIILGFFVFGVFLILGFGSFRITGNTVAVSSPTSCSVAELSRIWDSVFVESSSGADFYWNASSPAGSCSEYYGIKINGKKVWILVGDRINSSGMIQNEIYWRYINTTDSWLIFVENINSFSEEYFDNLKNFQVSSESENRASPLLESQTNSEFVKYFKNDYGPWAYHLGLFAWVYFEYYNGEKFNYQFSSELHENNTMNVVKYLDTNTTNYISPVAPTFTQNISNYTFEANSSWNVAFDIDDYVDFNGLGCICGMLNDSGTYYDNSLFDKINCSIDIERVVRFKPIISFIGNRTFNINCMKEIGQTTISNEFIVKIVEDINYAPVLKKEIENLDITRGGLSILDMRDYFEDLDEDNLTYSIKNGANLNFKFNNHLLSVSLGNNFSSQDYFYITASDGEFEKNSNKIFVFIVSNNTFIAEIINNSENNSATLVENNLLENESVGTADEKDLSLTKKFAIFALVIIICVVTIAIVMIIYFGIRKRNINLSSKSPEQKTVLENFSVQENSSDKVQEYLDKLKEKSKS